jgi:hypothetical protein
LLQIIFKLEDNGEVNNLSLTSYRILYEAPASLQILSKNILDAEVFFQIGEPKLRLKKSFYAVFGDSKASADATAKNREPTEQTSKLTIGS